MTGATGMLVMLETFAWKKGSLIVSVVFCKYIIAYQISTFATSGTEWSECRGTNIEKPSSSELCYGAEPFCPALAPTFVILCVLMMSSRLSLFS